MVYSVTRDPSGNCERCGRSTAASSRIAITRCQGLEGGNGSILLKNSVVDVRAVHTSTAYLLDRTKINDRDRGNDKGTLE